MKLEGAQVAVVGMARSGIAAVELLLEHGAHVRPVDQNPNPILVRGHNMIVEPQSARAFQNIDLIVLSPGVPADLPLVQISRQRGVPIIGDLELASWFLLGKVIGITGSNGKTTTTALTGHILKYAGIPMQVGGNIGTAPARMVASSQEGQWNVLELSSFQLETTVDFRARIGAVLNVTPDHLDRHYTIEQYAEAKARMFTNQTSGDFAVLNADDLICASFTSRGKRILFSSTRQCRPGAYFQDSCLVLNGQYLMSSGEIPLRGLHNVENVLAAAAITSLAGVSHEQIRAAVAVFPGVEHRLEFVRNIGGVDWYNDSKATNVDATLKAIAAFESGLWVILGGKDKNSDYTALTESLRAKTHGVLLIGSAAEKIDKQLSGVVPVFKAGTLVEAVKQAQRLAKTGETVLLAPACASFDQFQNFEHRGREFKQLVQELKDESWRD